MSDPNIRSMDPEDCRQLISRICTHHQLEINDLMPHDQSMPNGALTARYPKEAYRTIGIVSSLLGQLDLSTANTFFYVCACGIWPSSEDWCLYNNLRKASGLGHNLPEAPHALEFTPGTEDHLKGYLLLAILFGWDVFFGDTQRRFLFFFSHDEWFRFVGDESLRDKVETVIIQTKLNTQIE